MLKPYTRQQIMTDKVLSSISNIHEKNILEQILAHKNTLYNIIPITQYNTPLKDIITNTDNVVIVIDKQYTRSIFSCLIIDKNGGYFLDTLKHMFVGTESFTVPDSVGYVIETNYKSIHDISMLLP